MPGLIARNIIIDEPSAHDQFRGKGHERTADALVRAISTFHDQDRAIGLDGPWGSGKSTVVEIARRKLSPGPQGKTTYQFFTFDIWQSQGSSFRRSFLERFLDWSRSTFPEKDAALAAIERDVKGKVRHVQSNNRSMLDWWGIIVILLVPFLPIYYFWAKSAFDEKKGASFFVSGPFIVFLSFVAITLIKAGHRYLKEPPSRAGGARSFWTRYREALSQTLLITAKQYEDQKVTQYIRETDPNDFEFQATLRRILSIVQNERCRVVIVLDNIDRLPRKELNDYWAQVRAVFSSGPSMADHGGYGHVTAIVPYDRHLVEEGSRPTNPGSGGDANTAAEKNGPAMRGQVAKFASLAGREIFSKTFDEILAVSPPVMSNSRDFFIQKMREALPQALESDELFQTYLIYDRMLRAHSRNSTPRQIISFINELTGIFVLHHGRFPLPTIAMYMAYQDDLEADPDLLNRPDALDGRLRTLVADPDLERNLAAIIFNVEPELAFQLLLDNKIKEAAVGPISELQEIARAPGFDLRVHDVVQDNLREWNNSGELGKVINNFVQLNADYQGDARRHYSRTLVRSFDDVDAILLDEAEYLPLLDVFELATEEDIQVLTFNVLRAGLASMTDEPAGLRLGRKWASFVANVNRRLADRGNQKVLMDALASTRMPNHPAFLFGVASTIDDNGPDFAAYGPHKPQPMEDDEGESVLANLAVEYPQAAMAAFARFDACSLLAPPEWLKIASALIKATETEGLETGTASSYIDLLAETVARLPSENYRDVDVSALFSRLAFYEAIQSGSAEGEGNPLGSALFMALLLLQRDALPVPTKRQPNGSRVSVESEAYEWFRTRYAGEEETPEPSCIRAADLGKAAGVISGWLTSGREVPSDVLLRDVVKAAFVSRELPRTGLSQLTENYSYLRPLLEDQFTPMLARYDQRVRSADIQSLQLLDCPVGLYTDTLSAEGEQWAAFQERIRVLVANVPAVEWKDHLLEGDHQARLLLEVIRASQFVHPDPLFRDVLTNLVLGTLAGTAKPSDGSLSYDLLFDAVDARFHSDINRKLREDLRDVNGESLTAATLLYPRIIEGMIVRSDTPSRDEKDNLIRYMLCPALESGSRQVLAAFERVGRAKVRDYIKNSEPSTKEKLDGAWSTFASIRDIDRVWAKQIGELVHGKRKVKSVFDPAFWLGSGKNIEEEEEV